MKQFCLIRHAKSDWANESLEDIDRPLNARGYQDAKTMALRLQALPFRPDAVCSSTAVRASSTALIFARTFGMDEKQILLNPGLYEADEDRFLAVLKGLPDSLERVLVFGHNPVITSLVTTLSGVRIDNVPTCGVVMFESPAERWKNLESCRFLFFDYPKKGQ